MPIPYKPRGNGDHNSSAAGKTRYRQLYMSDMEYSLPKWTSFAYCGEMDQSLFFYEGAGSRPALEEGASICNTKCQVREQCLKSAEDYDLYWSVRGGRLPDALDMKQTSPRLPEDDLKPRPVESPAPCWREHERIWVRQGKNAWKAACNTCKAEAARRKREGLPPIAAPKKPLSELCSMGHNEWTYYSTNNKIRECRICKRAKDRQLRNTGSYEGWRDTLKA